jgi:hypothetical protein
MATVLHENEVMLFSHRFPIYGPVRRSLVSPFPGKLTIGDYSRDDNVIESTWAQSSFSGGLGVERMDPNADTDRFRFSTLSTIYPEELTLAAEVTQFSAVGPADAMIDYNEQLYRTVGNQVRLIDLDTGTDTVVGPALPAPARDAAVYFGNLYFITPSGLVEYISSTNTWTTYADGSGIALVGWDDKLFRLTNNNEIYWTTDPAVLNVDTDNDTIADSAWTYGGQVPLPTGYVNQLLIFFDVTGEPTIFAISRVGAWAYNFDARKFHRTGAKFPTLGAAGRGAEQWRDTLYIPAGTEEYRFNNNTFQPTGPNQDEGLPSSLRGDIVQITGGHAFRYLFLSLPPTAISSGEDEEPDVDESYAFDSDSYFNETTALGAILFTAGTSWHVAWIAEDIGSGFGAALVADIEGTHRLWFTTGNGLFYLEAPVSLHKPTQRPEFRFQATGYLITPWYDAGWRQLPKLALGMEFELEDMSDTEAIAVSYAVDGSDDFTTLTTLTTSGVVQANLGGVPGVSFKSIRFRFDFTRGTDSAKSPVLKAFELAFTRMPKRVWGWEFEVSVDDSNLGFGTATDIRKNLLDIVEHDNAGLFVYKDDQGEDRAVRVSVSSVSGIDMTGTDDRGQFRISLVELRDFHQHALERYNEALW